MGKDLHAQGTTTLRPGYGIRPPPSQWHESNCALARLLATHRRVLDKAIGAAVEIGRGLDELTPRMAALCSRTCRFCPDPCCITNTVWFDFRDLLLFHLLDAPIPICQAASDPEEACPFLTCRGCRLTARFRPWMCIQYLCPAQRAILDKQGRQATSALLGRIEKIGKQRFRMEAEVISSIKHRTRPLPSSVTADPRGEYPA